MNSAISVRPQGWWFSSDEIFNTLFPPDVQLLARRHWTPLPIARAAIDFLTPHDNVRILDIGSGIGKLCLAGAHFKPSAFFAGVEQRANLVQVARDAQARLQLDNTFFYHDNFTGLDFNEYDHFYFFNSFYENLMVDDKIDENITHSTYLFNYYHKQLYKKLNGMPAGTRVATFHCLNNKIPPNYHVVDSKVDTLLKFWIKVL